jgi:hypothetical protein
LKGGDAGSLPYQSAVNTTVFLAEPDADNKVLSYNNTSNAPTWIDISTIPGIAVADKIFEGNTSAEVVDTGTNGHFKVLTEGTERFRIKPTTNTYADCDDITLNAGGGVATSNNVTGVINLGSSYSIDGTGNDLGAGSGHWSAVLSFQR